MTYYHWAAEPVALKGMTYPQMGHPKPNGLWFDVDGSWKQWCEAVQFRPEHLKCRHTVTLRDTSGILFLRNIEDIDDFTSRYGQDVSGNIQPVQGAEDPDTFARQYGEDLFRDVLGQFSNYIMWGDVAGSTAVSLSTPISPREARPTCGTTVGTARVDASGTQA